MPDISFHRQTTISFPGSSIPDITSGIVDGSLVVREILCTDKIAFGDINSNQFQVSLYDCPDLTGKKIKVTQTDLDTSTTVDVFTGWVDSCKTDDLSGFRNIVAYDYFYKARKKKIKGWWKNFWSSRKSATVGTIWRNMFDYYNVSYVDTQLACDGITVKKTKKTSKLKVTRFTDFLSQVCELGICIPNVNRSGAIEFIKLYELDDTTFTDIRGDYSIKNSKFEDYAVAPYDKIELYNEDSELVSEAGTGDNVLAIQNNLFLYSKKKAYTDDVAQMLLDTMHDFDYIPADIEMKLANQELTLGTLVRTQKGLCLIAENDLTGSLLVNQTLRSTEREDGVEIQNGKAKTGQTTLGTADIERDIDRLDYKIDLATPELTLAKLDDGRVVIRDPKLADDDDSIVTRTFYYASYSQPWPPAQAIWRVYITSTVGSFLITNTEEGYYFTTNGIPRQFGMMYMIFRVTTGSPRPPLPTVVQEIVWHNNYHPEYTGVLWPDYDNAMVYIGTRDGYDFYHYGPGVGGLVSNIAREYTIPDYTAPDSNTLWNDLLWTDKIPFSNIQTGDSILPSATAQEKAAVAAGNLARKAAGNTTPLTPTGAYGAVNVASDDKMEELATNLNNLNAAMDNNTRQITTVESSGTVTGLQVTTYGGTQVNLLEANPTGTSAGEMKKLAIGGTIYDLAGGAEAITLTQSEYDQLSTSEKEDLNKVYYITDGTVTGQNIVPNPTGTPADDLSSLQIDNTIFALAGGTEVEANPSETATDTLQTVKIDDTVYEIEGGGSGGSVVALPSLYSTKEKMVGLWTNNKPLYQRTFHFSEVNCPSNTWTALPISIANIEECPSIKVCNNSWAYLGAFVIQWNTSPIEIYNTRNAALAVDTITIQYTKTTDTPVEDFNLQDFGIFAPVIYSTEEREVGVWTDGKPIYQKTIDSINDNNWHDISNLHIETLVNEYGWFITNNQVYQFNLWADSSYTSYIQVGLDYNRLMAAVNGWSTTKRVVTLQYTKTTDVAGSGHYAALGVPAVHYDDTERVIGTWFGKPLYSRAYSITATSAWNSTTKIATLDATWIITRIDSVVKENNVQFSMPYVNGMGSIRLEVDNGTDLYIVANGTSYAAGSVAQIIIEYTKTTD